jgi:type II secretory pathway component GspD/PulD (secretin)
MRIFILAGITLLAANAAFAQPRLAPKSTEPWTVIFVNTGFVDVMSFVAKQSGIEITIDENERHHTISRVNLEKASLEEVLETLTHLVGLSWEIVDEKTVRIFKKP